MLPLLVLFLLFLLLSLLLTLLLSLLLSFVLRVLISFVLSLLLGGSYQTAQQYKQFFQSKTKRWHGGKCVGDVDSNTQST